MQVLTHFPLLKALGWALFNSLWQMAALWLLYSLIMAVFHKAAATIRHRLSLLLLGAGAMWTAASLAATLLSPGNDGSFILSILSPWQPGPRGIWQSIRGLVEEVLPYGSTLYLLILSGLLIRYCANYRHSRRLTREGLSAMPPQFRTFVSATALQLGIRMPVKAWLSSLIDVPLTLGFLKPVILLPAAMITRLTPQQVEAILIHELAHIQRRDYLVHLLVTILEGLYFFNPFARLLIRQLKKERENCCDDMVLQFKYDAHAYVSALLSLASLHQPAHRLAVAATGSDDRLLLQRAKRILLQQTDGRRRPGTRPLLLLLVTLLITGLTLYRPLIKTRAAKSIATRTRTIDYIRPQAGPVVTLQSGPVVTSQAGPTAKTLAASPEDRVAETAFDRTILLTAPPRAHQHNSSRTRRIRHRSVPASQGLARVDMLQDPGNDFFVNTSNDGFAFGNSDGTPVMVAIADAPGGNADADADSRDYSLNIPQGVTGPSLPAPQGSPFLPNSIFSFPYTAGDSLHPAEQLLYLQQSAQLDILAAIAKLQQQTAAQWMALTSDWSRASQSHQMRKEILLRQKQIQANYYKKIESWQQKLQKASRIKMIVYI